MVEKIWCFSPNIRHLTPLKSIGALRNCGITACNDANFMRHNPFRISNNIPKSDARFQVPQAPLLEGVT